MRIYPFAAVFAGASFFSFLHASPASAQPVRDKELTTLQTDLDRETKALSTSDCAVACRALASIRRAADRICALDPDERCTDARAKAEAAAKKVRDACPACVTAGDAPPPSRAVTPAPEQPREHAGKGGAPDAPTATRPEPAAAPPSESRRGGCAGCTTGGAPGSDLASASLLMGALALLRRRRARKTSAITPSR